MGPHTGRYKAQFQCMVIGCDGRSCGTIKEITHMPGRAISTSNLITHLQQLSSKCPKHLEALTKVEKGSKNCVEIGGVTVKIMDFSEAFSCAAAPPASALA